MSADVIAPCLQSLRAAVRDGIAEVSVVDNGSPDESAALVAAEFGFAALIRTGENRGFAGGCNAAWPTVRGDYWLLLNPDTVVPRGGVEALTAFMDEHPALGAASPAFVDSLRGLAALSVVLYHAYEGSHMPACWRTCRRG